MASDAGTPGRSEQVSELVSAMQSGQISKSELYSSLGSLRAREAAPGAGGEVQRL
eukprot:CAMPEP_0119293530 /NCGR_PEP_ID=MMETSP1329-20130426/46266_1 /TAXON_ID=114041 /ORGANISM="Genus nov. species nov., Strain RCC1024" /LENGTH=54 /DNA_ID=CAMNT_0007294399 /DNA_START=141 /DNA_END=302 /DNA_ORIENTATION=-